MAMSFHTDLQQRKTTKYVPMWKLGAARQVSLPPPSFGNLTQVFDRCTASIGVELLASSLFQPGTMCLSSMLHPRLGELPHLG
jgi:hypothetical protein